MTTMVVAVGRGCVVDLIEGISSRLFGRWSRGWRSCRVALPQTVNPVAVVRLDRVAPAAPVGLDEEERRETAAGGSAGRVAVQLREARP
jgi:hypothetical protein